VHVEEVDSDYENDDQKNQNDDQADGESQSAEEEDENVNNKSEIETRTILQYFFYLALWIAALFVLREVISFFTKTTQVLDQVTDNGTALAELRKILRDLTG